MAEVVVEAIPPGAPVLGFESTVSFGAGRVFRSGDVVESLGPFSPDAPSSSFSAFNAPRDGTQLRAVQALLPTGPDAAFQPPEPVHRIPLGYFGQPLAVEEFEITLCIAADYFGEEIDATCGLVDFRILY